jgi:hypothetical protein
MNFKKSVQFVSLCIIGIILLTVCLIYSIPDKQYYWLYIFRQNYVSVKYDIEFCKIIIVESVPETTVRSDKL